MRDKMKNILMIWLAGGLLLVAGCVTQQTQPEAEGDHVDVTDMVDHQKGVAGEQIAVLTITAKSPVFHTYTIAPGDVLDVVYHLQRTLNREFPITLYHTVAVHFVDVPEMDQEQDVLPDGTISLPYLGSYRVVGKTVEQLRSELTKAYSKILRDPDLYVVIKNFNARVEQVRRDLHTSGRGLSKLISVRPDGYATFPLVGEHYVVGRTIRDVHKELVKAYNEYLPGLQVDLFMHEQSGTQVYVLGEVGKPGPIKVVRPLNVLEAIARVGGYTHEARTESVLVFRRKEDRLVAHRFNIKDMARYGAQAMNFYLQPDDVLLVPRHEISSAAQLMSEIANITFFRGLGLNLSHRIR